MNREPVEPCDNCGCREAYKMWGGNHLCRDCYLQAQQAGSVHGLDLRINDSADIRDYEEQQRLEREFDLRYPNFERDTRVEKASDWKWDD